LLVINNAAPIAEKFNTPAVLGLIVTVSNGVGRVVFEFLFDVLGRKVAANLSIMNFALIPAEIIGSMISSNLYEKSNASWLPVFIMFAVLGGCGMMTLILLNRATKREKLE
jgi:MFS family permease